jgi:hypothetical protein
MQIWASRPILSIAFLNSFDVSLNIKVLSGGQTLLQMSGIFSKSRSNAIFAILLYYDLLLKTLYPIKNSIFFNNN